MIKPLFLLVLNVLNMLDVLDVLDVLAVYRRRRVRVASPAGQAGLDLHEVGGHAAEPEDEHGPRRSSLFPSRLPALAAEEGWTGSSLPGRASPEWWQSFLPAAPRRRSRVGDRP